MRREVFIVSIIACLLLVQAANAELILGQTKSTYNLGDTVSTFVTVRATENSDDFLNVNLVCSQGEKTILFVPLKLSAGEEKNIQSNVSLTRNFLGDMRGECEIDAVYAGDKQSQSFQILDSLLVELNIANNEISAGGNFSITGQAKRSDGSPINGFVDLTIEGTSINARAVIENGEFSSSIAFPGNLKAGSYTLNAKAYEKDNEGSSGEASSILIMGSEARRMEVSLAKNSLTPPGNLSFKILMYDQADIETAGSASVSIKDANGDLVYSKILQTGEVVALDIEGNASAGYWNIEASSNGLNVKRLFYVSDNEQASFQIVNSTLIITNTGNVFYKKAVEIDIGSEAQIEQMNLDLGESVRFRLLAPNGVYKVAVTDGKTSLNMGDISLTGNVVGVEDVRNQANMVARYPMVWLFLIVVIGLFLFLTIEGVRKRGISIYSPKKAIKAIGGVIKAPSMNGMTGGDAKGVSVRRETKESFMQKAGLSELIRTGDKIIAEYSIVMKGSRTLSTIISLKMKNMNKFSGEVKNRINDLFKELSYKKAAIMETQEFIIIILSPVLTKTFNNEVTGIKIALNLKEALLKYKDIDFGIGVHVGEIIGGVEQGRFKFTPLGTTLSYAKKVSDLAEKEVLLSKDIHTKTMSEVKAIRTDMFGNELYKVESVTDREKYSNFIAGFKNRQSDEAKKQRDQDIRNSLNKST